MKLELWFSPMTAPIILSNPLVSTKSFDQLIKEWLNKLQSSFYLIG